MHSTVHTSSQVLGDLALDWEALHEQSPTATLFNHPRWAALWWKHFGHEGDLRLLAVQSSSGALLGLAPLYVDRQGSDAPVLRLIGGVDVADYLDFVVPPVCDEEITYVLLDCWASELADDLPVLDLHSIPEASPTRELLRRWAEDRGFFCHERVEDVSPVIALPDTWEEYLSSLSKKQRHEVRRKRRKAEREAELSWFYVEDWHRIPSAVEEFIALHQLSSKDKEDFMTPEMQTFLRELAALAYAEGWLKLAFLKLDDRMAASYFCFDYRNDILVYNSGYDPELAPGLSPGNVLISFCIEDAIRQGRNHFDFLRGEETYKFRLGAVATHVYQVTVSREKGGGSD